MIIECNLAVGMLVVNKNPKASILGKGSAMAPGFLGGAVGTLIL